MTSIYILGNCHVYGMLRSIKFFDSALLVEGCHVWDLPARFADAAEFVSHAKAFHHVLTYSFDQEFIPGLSSVSILRDIPQARLYPTISFGAFHPDVVYLFKNGQSDSYLSSPLGPYHSALVLYGFKKGYDIERTMSLFHSATFERLGYFATWNVAIDALTALPEARDFDLSNKAHKWLRQGCFMHNPQHPKALAVSEIAKTAMHQSGLVPKHSSAASFLPDDLVASHIWPVYPEVGRFYGLHGNYTFKRESGISRWPEFMTLEEFVTASYECYGLQTVNDYYCERVDGWLQAGLDL